MKKQLFLVFTICGLSTLGIAQSAGGGACSDLFISEYVEGDGNNRALELYNPTSSTIDLGNYSVGRYANGFTNGMFADLAGSIAPHETYVICLDKRDPNGTGAEVPIWAELEAAADTFLNPVYVAANSPMYFNGNDAVALRRLGTVIDVIGKIGEDPGTGWFDFATGTWSTANQTLVRKSTIQMGDWNGTDIFYPDTEWDNYPANTFSNLGSHSSSCLTPACASNTNFANFTSLNTSYNVNDPAVTLTATPPGGVFFGNGVSGNQFSPGSAGVGTHSIVYTVVDGNGCVHSEGLCTTVDFNVGIGGTEIASTEGLDVYPNPSTGRFTLSLEDVTGVVRYSVYDAQGKEIAFDAFVANGITQETIDLTDFAEGVYTLQLNTTKGSFTGKLVKD